MAPAIHSSREIWRHAIRIVPAVSGSGVDGACTAFIGSARGADCEITGSTLIGLQAALEHGSLAAVQSRCAEALPELKTMLRALLHYHLGSPVMRTRQVMLDVQSLSANPSSP